MNILWCCTFTLMVALYGFSAQAQTEQERTLSALQALQTASQELERQDSTGANATLASMRETVADLRSTGMQYQDSARAVEKSCQDRTYEVEVALTSTHQRRAELERRQSEFDGELRRLQAENQNVDANLARIRIRIHELSNEVEDHRRCTLFVDPRFYFDNLGLCLRLLFEAPIPGVREGQLEHEIADLSGERALHASIIDSLRSQRQDVSAKTQENNQEIQRLGNTLQSLQSRGRTLREVVVGLSNITLFWGNAVSLIDSGMDAKLSLLQKLLPLLDEKANAPLLAGDGAKSELEIVDTFRDKLIQFARSVDDRTNFLNSGNTCAAD